MVSVKGQSPETDDQRRARKREERERYRKERRRNALRTIKEYWEVLRDWITIANLVLGILASLRIFGII